MITPKNLRLNATKRRYSQLKKDAETPTDDLHRQMFEQSRTVQLVVSSSDMRIVDANRTACDYYGYTISAITELTLSELIEVPDTELHDYMQRTLTEKGITFRAISQHVSGKNRQVEFITSVLEVGGTAFIHATTYDLTEQQNTTTGLGSSHELYRIVIQNMPNSGIILFDNELRYVLGEGPFLNRFGSIFKDIAGKTPQEVLPPESLEFLLPIYQRALQGESFHFERDTDVFAYESYVTPVHNDAGAIIGGMILSHDITDTKRAEKALRESEERLRFILDNIEDLVTYDDVRGRFVYVSPSCKKMLGYSSEELQNASSIEFIHPDDRESMKTTLQEAIRSRTPQFTVEGRMLHANGHYVEIETVGKLVSDDGISFKGGIFTSRDITERKHLQEIIREKEKLEVALKKETEFSAYKTRMMQHINNDFRIPLALIQDTVDTLVLRWSQLTAAQRRAKSSDIKAQIKLITNKLDAISLVANNSIKATQLQQAVNDISDLCFKVAAELEFELRIPGKYKIEPIEPVMMAVDERMLNLALSHILRNAAQHTDFLEVVTVHIVKVRNGVEIRIIDHGKGIVDHEQHMIFEPFFRGSNVDQNKGLGIGLSLAKAVIEAHRGYISVMSALNKGTSVTVWLPH